MDFTTLKQQISEKAEENKKQIEKERLLSNEVMRQQELIQTKEIEIEKVRYLEL